MFLIYKNRGVLYFQPLRIGVLYVFPKRLTNSLIPEYLPPKPAHIHSDVHFRPYPCIDPHPTLILLCKQITVHR